MLEIKLAVIKFEVCLVYQYFTVKKSEECFNVFNKDIKHVLPSVCLYSEKVKCKGVRVCKKKTFT